MSFDKLFDGSDAHLLTAQDISLGRQRVMWNLLKEAVFALNPINDAHNDIETLSDLRIRIIDTLNVVQVESLHETSSTAIPQEHTSRPPDHVEDKLDMIESAPTETDREAFEAWHLDTFGCKADVKLYNQHLNRWIGWQSRGQSVPEWLPIEAAPKDGTAILLYCGTSQRVSITGGYWDDHQKCRCWIAGGYMQKTNPPTHWMPLPQSPKSREK